MEQPLSEIFADHILRVEYARLPPQAVERARQSTLDTIGVIMAGSALEPSVNGLLELVLEAGGREECSVLGTSWKVPAIMAAFANGGMAHCLDYDDHTPQGHHPSSSVIPVSLALAERLGNVSGKKFLTAVALGQDLFVRLRRNVVWRHDYHLTTILGVFSATASAAYLLGLNRDQIASAFGIAGVQSSGCYELVEGVNNELRGLYAGFVSKAAMVSALMAEKSIKGPHSIFEGAKGFFNVYFAGQYDRTKMLEGLGEIFQGTELLYKPWPSVGLSHSFIHAACRLRAMDEFDLDSIETIKVYAGPGLIELCEPLAERCNPKTGTDAKFSIPFNVALALVNGTVLPPDFQEAALQNRKVRDVAGKVVPVFDEQLSWNGPIPHGRVELRLKSGRTFGCIGDGVPGSEEAPMSWKDLVVKYKTCLRLARAQLSEERIEHTAQLIRGLEKQENLAQLPRLFAGG
ncbi:MAG: MmgE/PrpD family protein [Acidobacteria bacterium]|nr:MmgE/PrpD family protein [Acidobacteriota bacterium]